MIPANPAKIPSAPTQLASPLQACETLAHGERSNASLQSADTTAPSLPRTASAQELYPEQYQSVQRTMRRIRSMQSVMQRPNSPALPGRLETQISNLHREFAPSARGLPPRAVSSLNLAPMSRVPSRATLQPDAQIPPASQTADKS